MSPPCFLWRFAFGLVVITSAGCMKQDDPGPPAADQVVFRASGKQYPRKPQTVPGKRPSRDFDVITLKAEVVADAAQIYADFSRKEVRVSQVLLDRKLMFGSAASQVAAGYVVWNFDWQLRDAGIDIVPIGRGVVAFRAGKTMQEKLQAQQPAAAKPAEIAAASAAMSEDHFWKLIENARRSGRGDCFKISAALEAALRSLTTDEILGFEQRLLERMAESYRWDLWAVAYIVNGGASDDGFEYFRGWLIAQGREYYQAALKNPERAADRAGRHQQNECEQILYPAIEAYRAKTNQLPPIIPIARSPEPTGQPWSEEQLPKLYPELMKKFR